MNKTIVIPAVGTIVYVPELNRRNGIEKDNRDISWEILSTVTYQDNDGEIRTVCTMMALDAEGEEIETIQPENLIWDMYDQIDV